MSDKSRYVGIRVVTTAGTTDHLVVDDRLRAIPSRTRRWLHIYEAGQRVATHRMSEVVSFYGLQNHDLQ